MIQARFITPLVLAFVATVLSTPSQADKLRSFTVGNWSGGAYSFDGTKRFSHCAASASYRNGMLMLFSVNRNYQWNIGFASDNFSLIPRQNFKIALSIDGQGPSIVTAFAVTNRFATINLAPTATLFSRFRHGYTVKLIAKDMSSTFNLTGTSQLLPALVNCVTKSLTPLPMQAAGPSSAGNTTGSMQPPTKEDHRAEATALVANLLSQAGIKDFRIAPTSNDEIGKTADAYWAADKVSGALFIALDPSIKKPADATPQLISLAAKACKGTFFSGAMPLDVNGAQSRVFTTCQNGKNTKTVYYLTMPRPVGGHYIFITMADGSEEPAKKADASIRSAVLNVVGH